LVGRRRGLTLRLGAERLALRLGLGLGLESLVHIPSIEIYIIIERVIYGERISESVTLGSDGSYVRLALSYHSDNLHSFVNNFERS